MNKSDKQLLILVLAGLGILVLAAFAPVLSQSANAIICRFEATPCETVWNSNDDVFYRDAGGTETIRLDGQGSARIAVPTQVGTATPGLVIQAGANSNAFEIRNAGATPVFQVGAGGAIVASQILTQAASLEGLTVSQPTAATTATPAALIDSLAAGTNLLEIRDAATPVFTIRNGGAVSGLVLQYGTAGQRLYCNVTSAFTTSVAITSSTSAIATPVAALCSLAADATGDAYNCTAANATGTITLKVWGNQATPVANTTPVAVNYCILGTP